MDLKLIKQKTVEALDSYINLHKYSHGGLYVRYMVSLGRYDIDIPIDFLTQQSELDYDEDDILVCIHSRKVINSKYPHVTSRYLWYAELFVEFKNNYNNKTMTTDVLFEPIDSVRKNVLVKMKEYGDSLRLEKIDI